LVGADRVAQYERRSFDAGRRGAANNIDLQCCIVRHIAESASSSIDGGEDAMSRWFVLLDGPQEDFVHIKRLFTASRFAFDRIDGKNALSAPTLEYMQDTNDVIDAGMGRKPDISFRCVFNDGD
jgi:hypothetical protein